MTTEQIVREEAKNLAKGMLPLFFLTLIGLLVCGQRSVGTMVSLVGGTAYSFGLFLMIGANAAKAVLYPAEQAVVIVRKGYALRYCITGALLVMVFNCPFFNPVAAVLPLFYPKIVLLANSIFPKKGG